MRDWTRLVARNATWRPGDLVDVFVNSAHHDPVVAIAMLRRNRSLAAARSSWGETALEAASHLGHRDLIECLVESGAGVDLFAACAMGDSQAVRGLIHDSDLAACGVHALPLLHFGVMSRDLGMVELLLRQGVELNPRGASLSPLHSAVAIGSVPMIRALVAAGVDCSLTDAFGATALDWAYDVEDRGSALAVLLSGYLRRATADLLTAG